MSRTGPGSWAGAVRIGLLTVLVGGTACDGSTQKARPASDGPIVDAGRAETAAPAPSDGPLDISVPEVAPPPQFPPPPAAVPLPAGVKPPQRLLGPADRLAGNGASACSEPDPAKPGDRWCVFYRTITSTAVSTDAGPGPPITELWVVNVSKAAAGVAPRCDGSSADCIRLTTTLWTGLPLGGPGHPFSHEFGGETLIYYAASTSSGQQIHRGPVTAWRPGWTSARTLTSDKGVMCTAHRRKPVVYCMDDLQGDPMRPDSFELRLGSVEPPPSVPLPAVGRVRPFDASGAVAWEAAFSSDGEQFVISSPDPDPAVETMRVLSTKDGAAAMPREILRGATRWALGNDGSRIYFMRPEPTADGGAGGSNEPKRSLHAADFPSGQAEVKIAGAVRDYILLGDEGGADNGVAFLSTSSGDRTSFRFLRDSRTPAGLVTLFTYRDLLEGVRMSPDLRYTVWLDAGFNARVIRHRDLAPCKLNVYARGAAFDPQFLDNAGLVFWNEDAPTADRREGFYARPEDCGGVQRFATSIAYYTPLGDRGLLYTDDKDDAQRASLKLAALRKHPDGSVDLAPPMRIHDHVEEGYFTVVGRPASLVLFRTHGADEPDPGTYVFGPLPL